MPPFIRGHFLQTISKGEEMKLILKGCEHYIGPRVANNLVVRGQEVEVSEEDGAYMLGMQFVDGLNNSHPLFELAPVAEPEEGEAETQEAPKQIKALRKRQAVDDSKTDP